MDYRRLNDIIKKDRYLLPLIKETLSSISKVRYFTKLDITTVFYKICIAKGYIDRRCVSAAVAITEKSL